MGITYYAMGRKDKARAEWQEALRKNPNDKKARMYMSLVSEKK